MLHAHTSKPLLEHERDGVGRRTHLGQGDGCALDHGQHQPANQRILARRFWARCQERVGVCDGEAGISAHKAQVTPISTNAATHTHIPGTIQRAIPSRPRTYLLWRAGRRCMRPRGWHSRGPPSCAPRRWSNQSSRSTAPTPQRRLFDRKIVQVDASKSTSQLRFGMARLARATLPRLPLTPDDRRACLHRRDAAPQPLPLRSISEAFEVVPNAAPDGAHAEGAAHVVHDAVRAGLAACSGVGSLHVCTCMR